MSIQIPSIGHSSYNKAYINDLLLKSKNLKLDKKKYWKVLLHYNKDQSVINDDKFFLSSNGGLDSELELQESIKYLFNNNTSLDNNHPSCKFPARFKWLKSELSIPKKHIPQANCKDLQEYLDNISAEQIDISFASENINSL
ncbi:hypothetical protein N8772_02760, partial [Rickettsiales bacterium]|nr:hypothetical protein [Rickettsiales bacterium]